MTNAKMNLPENYIQEILETYADGLEKHKGDTKTLLTDLLKASDKLGKRIASFEDYEKLQATVAEMETNGDFSWLQKLGLKDLKAFITKEYPQYGQEWLEKKHSEEKKWFTKLFPAYWVSYIDNLIQENKNLAPESLKQFNTIKELFEEHNPTMDLSQRLTIQNNLVCIDGYTLPTWVTHQEYNKMKKNPEGLTYPKYAKALLTFAADITGTTFTFPTSRDILQKWKIDSAAFSKEINTDNNKSIIKTLQSIVWFDSEIPVWLDKDGYIIYVVVRSVSCIFFYLNYNDYYNCLVSSA